ncbi:MAG TPA: thioesterase family protein [Ramlibacter sp.]|nr:thioesterase family protein [Ramlibacter sp.]
MSDAVDFESDFMAGMKEIWEQRVPFNRFLGLQIQAFRAERVAAGFAIKPELAGHLDGEWLHGGAISAALDAVGGLAVMAAFSARHKDEPAAHRLRHFDRMSTIDLRVDYLRPPAGARFEVRAEVMRLGSRVACTRMEFFAAQGAMLACGTGAYNIAGAPRVPTPTDPRRSS